MSTTLAVAAPGSGPPGESRLDGFVLQRVLLLLGAGSTVTQGPVDKASAEHGGSHEEHAGRDPNYPMGAWMVMTKNTMLTYGHLPKYRIGGLTGQEA
jgi:hypothetical protein